MHIVSGTCTCKMFTHLQWTSSQHARITCKWEGTHTHYSKDFWKLMNANRLQQQQWNFLTLQTNATNYQRLSEEMYARTRTLLRADMHVNKCAKQYLPIFDSRLNTCHDSCNNYILIEITIPFWYWLTQVVPDKGTLNKCVPVCDRND